MSNENIQTTSTPVYLRPSEAAARYGVHPVTLARMRREIPGFPQPYNFGLGFSRVYKTEELERWFAEREDDARQRAAEDALPPRHLRKHGRS